MEELRSFETLGLCVVVAIIVGMFATWDPAAAATAAPAESDETLSQATVPGPRLPPPEPTAPPPVPTVPSPTPTGTAALWLAP